MQLQRLNNMMVRGKTLFIINKKDRLISGGSGGGGGDGVLELYLTENC